MTEREIGLVVLDLAGTVLDFGCLAPAGAFVQAFQEQGVTLTLAEARGPMGLHKKDHIRELLRQPAIGERFRTRHGRDWAESDVDALYRLVTPMQVRAAREHARLVPGVKECVAELRKLNVKIAVSTGYFHEAAEVCYTACREQGFVPDFAICADDVPAGRPRPWMIFRCMEALDVYPPRRVVKVGDTLVDIADGLNAGAWSVAVVDSSNEMGLSEADFAALSEAEREDRRESVRAAFIAADADEVMNTLADLPAYVLELNRRLTDSL